MQKSIKAAQDTSKGVKTSKDGTDVDAKDKYVTPVEAKQLADALSNAQAVFNNPNASQAQIDAAQKRLDAAKNAYDKAKKPGKKAPVTTKTALKAATAPNQTYTGKALKPAIAVKDAHGKVVPAGAYTVTYTNNTNPGTATATVTAKKDSKYTGTVKATFKITAKDKPVYWLVNKKTGENLYTAEAPEKNALVKKGTWTNKGIVWYAPEKGDAVYRLVNKKTGDHHWTQSKKEADTLVKRGLWRYDFSGKPAFYSGGGKGIWRLYNAKRQQAGQAGTHRFATSQAQVNTLKKSGWKDEGQLLQGTRYK